jgi:hypothetical protein
LVATPIGGLGWLRDYPKILGVAARHPRPLGTVARQPPTLGGGCTATIRSWGWPCATPRGGRGWPRGHPKILWMVVRYSQGWRGNPRPLRVAARQPPTTGGCLATPKGVAACCFFFFFFFFNFKFNYVFFF